MESLVLTHLTIPEVRVLFRKELESFFEARQPEKINEIEAPISLNAAREFCNFENDQTIYRMVREGRIPSHKKNGRLYFYKSELNAWIKSQKDKN